MNLSSCFSCPSRAATAGALLATLLLVACGGSGPDTDADASKATRPAAGRKQALAAAAAIAPPAASTWSGIIPLSMVTPSAAQLPDGRILLWSSSDRFTDSAPAGRTYTTLFDPATLTATETLVSATGHDMFCTGTTNLPDGRILVNGGKDSGKTSIYDPATNSWSTAATMVIPRGYNANTLVEDGSVFTLGGSWSGGRGNKHGERWTAAAGWQRLAGVPVDAALGNDPDFAFRADNHMWLFPAPNGQVLQAGPSAAMNWIETQGSGRILPAGPRGDDVYSQSGNAVMYDIGKVLKAGGATAYEGRNAINSAYVIDMNAGVSVRKVAPMAYSRIFSNGVVLPNGQVLIVGGHTFGQPWSDNNSVLIPELWDPATEAFLPLPPMAVPRNYHSIALLLPDARVMVAGSGLCGSCATNHANAQILTPHYLLNADGSPATRPVIHTVPASATHGTSIPATTDSPVSAFSLVRLGSTTHTVNNDQRRIPLQFSPTGTNAYALHLPSNPGVLLPGYYMLFAMNDAGVPSVSRMVRISGNAAPRIVNPGTQNGSLGTPVTLPLTATTPTGTLSFSATGLPPGLAIDPASGTIHGMLDAIGQHVVTLTATNGTATTSTMLLWNISPPVGAAVQFVMLEAISETNGNAWTSMAEFNLLDRNGAVIPRAGWSVQVDSQEAATGQNSAAAAIDGNPATFWHTRYTGGNAPLPHRYIVNLGQPRGIGGFRYLPRPAATGLNGTIAGYNFYLSNDGANWALVKSGNLNDFPDRSAEKTLLVNRPPSIAFIANQNSVVEDEPALSVSGGDPDGDALSYAASGLPPGLGIDPASGVIKGTATAVGSFIVTVQVADGHGGTASTTFRWTVVPGPLAIEPVVAPPVASGGGASYSVGSSGAPGTRYRWTFGDGTPQTEYSTDTNISHAYAAPGLYTVTVEAIDPDGVITTYSFRQAVYAPPTAKQPTHSSNLAIEPYRARVWMVNQDNDSVSVFDGSTHARIAEIPVGARPRSLAFAPDGRLWVVNKGDATISIIDPATLAVAQTVALPRASQPFGLAFAPDGGAAYLALEATGRLLKLDASSGAERGSVAVGAQPRHVSITAAGDRILVSRFVTAPLPGEGTASVQTTVEGQPRGGEVVVVRPTMAVERSIVLRHSDKPDSLLQGRGVPNYLAPALVSPDGRSAWVPSKQDNILRGTLRDGNNLDFQNTVRAISSRIDLDLLAEDHPARIDHDNSGLGSAAAFHPTGAYLFVALETSRQVAVVDPVGKAEVYRFAAGRAPDGVAVSADGLTLYVNNFMDRTLGVYDLTRLIRFGEFTVPLVTAAPAIDTDKLAASVLTGKQLFYDAADTRLARDAYISCAACHNDGGADGRTWDFTGLGEGLRNTITLRGRAGAQGMKHWTANFDEIQDFEGQLRGLGQGTGLMTDEQFHTGTRSQPLGDRKTGLSGDLDALAAYVSSLTASDASPWRNADGTLTAAAVAGRQVFRGAGGCLACHGGTDASDSAGGTLRNVGTIKKTSGRRLGAPLTGLDTQTLKGAWASAPYLHDGSAATLLDVLTTANAGGLHGSVGSLDAIQRSQLVAYLQQMDDTIDPLAPAGIDSLAVQDTGNAADWSVQANLQVGAQQFGDRAYTITGLPAVLAGGTWIRTANDSKSYTGSTLASFSLAQPADVYVTLDDRYTAPLAWMAGWSDTGLKMTTSENGTTRSFTVYTRAFGAGTVTLGPASQAGFSLYTVVVK
jgi:YVTN family beta-propeller protein